MLQEDVESDVNIFAYVNLVCNYIYTYSGWLKSCFCVQIPWESVGPVRRRISVSPTKQQEVTSGVGADQEVSTEGGGVARSLGKVLPRISSGGTLVWSRYMGAFVSNDGEVRGSACGFTLASHKTKVKAAKGWVLAAGDNKNSPTGSGDTAALDICGQETGDSGRVGGPRVKLDYRATSN